MVTDSGLKVDVKDREFQALETVSRAELDTVMSNLVDLESFSEGIILHQCRKRYERDMIYTFVGTILVAVNRKYFGGRSLPGLGTWRCTTT